MIHEIREREKKGIMIIPWPALAESNLHIETNARKIYRMMTAATVSIKIEIKTKSGSKVFCFVFTCCCRGSA